MDLNLCLGFNLVLFCMVFCVIIGAEDDYGIWHRTLTPFQSHACDNEELLLRCTTSTIISVHYVTYGRQENSGHLCPGSRSFYTGPCDSSQDALQVIHKQCHGNRMCRLYVTPETFGRDRCPGIRKFVEVMYKCRPETFSNMVVCEGGQLNMFCPSGQGLTIFSASYGTTKSGAIECRQPDGIITQDCLIEHAGETIRSICSGKQNCSLRADDRTFGNPGCAGTKYLKVKYNCVEKELLLPSSRRSTDETIQTTSFPAWARGIDQSSQNNFWPRGMEGVRDSMEVSTSSSDSSKLEMQSDEVPTDYKKETLSGNQELVGFMSKWMSAHKYMTGNKEKLILYVSVSLAVGFLVFVTVLAGRCVITRLESRRNSKVDITPETEDQFFSDSDLEQYDPTETLPPPIANYTASMQRKDSDALPRAPVSTGTELNHYFS